MDKRTIPFALFLIALSALAWLLAFIPEWSGKTALERRMDEGATRFFKVQSIDTMKFSRDLAREKLNDPSFDAVIAAQMDLIKQSGATHVAIDTPYDEELYPMLARWVNAARSRGLSIWFRGNFSGWEGWFGYAKMTPEEHKKKLADFLKNHQELFRDRDVFSPCPECENGGPGDPRSNGNKNAYNDFLAEEYRISEDAFHAAGKQVCIYTSMNADIARNVMTPLSIRNIGGMVLIDHYVKDPQALAKDVEDISDSLYGNVGIGEFGAPIPDIHGNMSESDQREFVRKALDALAVSEKGPNVVNYWVLEGGTTALVNPSGTKRQAFDVLTAYYSPSVVTGTVTDDLNDGLGGATVAVAGSDIKTQTGADGSYRILVPKIYDTLTISKDTYNSASVRIASTTNAALAPAQPSFWHDLMKKIR